LGGEDRRLLVTSY